MKYRHLALALALLFVSGAALGQPHTNTDANNASQPEAVERKPESKPAEVTGGDTKAGSEHKEEQCRYKEPGWFPEFYCFFALHDKFWVSFGTLVLAAFTIIFGIATAILAYATRRLVNGADDTAQRQLRAYVHLKEFDVREVPNPWGVKGMHATIPTLFLTWENAGQTPTRSALSNCNWWAFEKDIPSDFEFPDDLDREPVAGVLGPRQSHETNPKMIPIQILKEAAGRKLKIYVWAWIEYNDVFAGTSRHRTEFCAELTVGGLPDGKASTGCVYIPNITAQTTNA